jgi:hypothetical protein
LIAEIKVEREQEAPITISPPPPPPQPERIPTSAKPLATLKSSDEKAPKAESRGPATPTKMISSTDLGLQLKLLSPVAKRQLKPKEQSKDPTEQLRGVVEGVISARREKVGDSDSEDESAWSSSDEAVTNTALTYNSFVNIRAQESEAPLNTKKTLNDGIDTDDDADDEVFKDEDDDFLEDFTFISGGNVYEKPLPAPDFLFETLWS